MSKRYHTLRHKARNVRRYGGVKFATYPIYDETGREVHTIDSYAADVDHLLRLVNEKGLGMFFRR